MQPPPTSEHDETASPSPAPAPRVPWRERWDRLHGSYTLVDTTTTVDDRPLRTLAAGAVDALPEIVLVPGLGAPGYLSPWVRTSSAWTAVTLLDLPGWERGGARSCTPTVQGIAEAVARWLEITDRRDVVLVGHSTGAQAVLRTALVIPERLRGLVLAGPTFAPDVRTLPALLRRAATTLPLEAPGELPAAVPSYLSSGGPPLLRLLRDALPDRPEELVPQVSVPTLVMTGERDGFAPPAWAAHLARLASGRCAVLPGAHNAPFPFPLEADAALREAVGRWAH